MPSTLQRQPCASLTTLPQELQNAIVRLIVDGYQQGQGLLGLSYTCKRLRATCLPMIYEDVKLYGYWDKSCGKLYQPERLLAQTVSTSPAHVGQYIKKLELNGVEIRENIAERMLPHMLNLRTFIYRFEIQYNRDGLGTWTDTQTLGRALANVGQTLEHLEITYGFQVDEPRGIGPVLPPGAVDFMQLLALKYLLVPMSLLLGWRTDTNPRIADVLPKSLVKFSIDYDPDSPRGFRWEAHDVMGVLKTFVQHESWKRSTACLESITMHDYVWGDGAGPQERNRQAAEHLLKQNGLQYSASRRGVYVFQDDDDLYL